MKTRLFCLLLSLLMALSVVMTGCSSKDTEEAIDDITSSASESAVTLTMWIVSEEPVSDATAELINKELNSITQSKFKTQLLMRFLTEDEYRTELDKNMALYEQQRLNANAIAAEAKKRAEEEAKKNKGKKTETTETVETEAETVLNEYGVSVLKYPDVLENQVDILYIMDEGMYLDYIDKGWLTALDSELTGSSKKIKEYVTNTLLSAAKINGSTYAIPNNNAVGQYRYMLLNKQLMDDYSYGKLVGQGLIDGLYNQYVYEFLDAVSKRPDVLPIESTYEECREMLAYYWMVDPSDYSLVNNFSVFGNNYTDMSTFSRGVTTLKYESLFTNSDFTDGFLHLNRFYKSNYFGTADATKKTAIKFVTGDERTVAAVSDEYYAIVVGYPTATTDDIYSNMFGVCTYTRSVSRSMEIITYLNTNQDFRNILQWGVEGVHYKKVTDADNNTCIQRIKNGSGNYDYVMSVAATGNSFLVYPDLSQSMSWSIWESGKKQNQDALIDPLLGFDFASYAATTRSDAEEEASISTYGYRYSYTSGYSKDLLKQNSTLSAWLDACDAAGNGIYVFKTVDNSGQYAKYRYYFYNKGVSSSAAFNMIDEQEIEKTTDEKGIVTQTQKKLDFTAQYTGNEGTGYLISVVDLALRKTNTEFRVLCTSGNEEATMNVTEKLDAYVGFDFLNTEKFTINVSRKIGKTEVLGNAVLCPEAGSNGWLETVAKTKPKEGAIYWAGLKVGSHDNYNDYVFVVYRHTLRDSLTNTMTVIPTGEGNKLNLNFYMTDDGVSASDPGYSFYYITLSVDQSISVGLNDSTVKFFTKTGKEALATSTAKTVSLTKDPDLDLIGLLDTELVKYLYQLNTELVAIIEDVRVNGTQQDMEKLVKDLGTLLSPTNQIGSSSSLTNAKLVAFVDNPNKLVASNFDKLFFNLGMATTTKSYSAMKAASLESEWGGGVSGVDKAESFAATISPYGIYRSWLKKYSYEPSTK